MTSGFFFWYVLPFILAAGVFGWLAYDKYVNRDHLHPGE